jgi:hypothetical protein
MNEQDFHILWDKRFGDNPVQIVVGTRRLATRLALPAGVSSGPRRVIIGACEPRTGILCPTSRATFNVEIAGRDRSSFILRGPPPNHRRKDVGAREAHPTRTALERRRRGSDPTRRVE